MALSPQSPRRLSVVLLLAFGFLALAVFRKGVLEADAIGWRPFQDVKTGHRIAPPQSKKASLGPRGRIADRFGVILAADGETPTSARLYPCGPACFPVVGYAHRIFGKRHLEAKLDPILSAGGSPPPDVLLSLDAEAQKKAFSLLDGRPGAVVALDVKTGAIRVLASSPSFDPNTASSSAWEEAAHAKEKPFLNRAISELYPPGSTFKILVAAAALSSGFTPGPFYCTGRKGPLRVGDQRAHGSVDLFEAVVHSCNQFFGDLGVRLGPFVREYAGRFGFFDDLDLTWPLVLSGLHVEPSLAFARYRYESITDPDTGVVSTRRIREDIADFQRDKFLVAQGAIGQNVTMATPLQMALVALAVAADGVVLRPYLVEEVRRGEELLFATSPEAYDRVLSVEEARLLREMMAGVVSRGTARKLSGTTLSDGSRLRLAGKTGTAETVADDDAPHSWFIGFAPVEAPRVAVAVIVENAGSGGAVAGPIAAEMLSFLVERGEGDRK